LGVIEKLLSGVIESEGLGFGFKSSGFKYIWSLNGRNISQVEFFLILEYFVFGAIGLNFELNSF
jgi:hypothetical protein